MRTGVERILEEAVLDSGPLGERLVALRDRLEAATGRTIRIDFGLDEEDEEDEDPADPDDQTPEQRLESIRRYYATFLDRPIPTLLGLTPRQTAEDPALHPVVLALLRDHESGVVKHHGSDAVDFDAMRRELGLLSPEPTAS